MACTERSTACSTIDIRANGEEEGVVGERCGMKASQALSASKPYYRRQAKPIGKPERSDWASFFIVCDTGWRVLGARSSFAGLLADHVRLAAAVQGRLPVTAHANANTCATAT